MKKSILDRKYAKRIKNIDGLSQISIDLKPNRSVSDVFINQKMDMTELCKYVEAKKKSGSDITYFHAFLAGLGKLLYNRNKLNRFVSNRHIYEHNEVVISFVAKIAFDDKSEEIMMLIPIGPHDNIDSISKKIKDKVDKLRNNKKVNKKGANSAIDTIGKLPNIIRVPIVGMFKWCDKKGILPSSLTKDNVYYSSMMVSNLGSLHCGAIFHNINDFGNCSSLITMGEIREEEVLIDGKKQIKKLCEFGANLDERIADGYYFIKSLQMLQYIYNNPKLLEEDCCEKVEINE